MKTIKKITLLTAGLLASVASWADGTTAGTPVSNTATATYYAPGSDEQLETESNEEIFYVQELIKVSVIATSGQDTSEVEPGATNQVVSYTITNTGNGDEAYKVTVVDSATGDTLDLTAANIHIYYEDETEGYQGTESSLLDDLINLTPGQSVTILVVVDIPSTAVDGDTAITELNVVSQTTGASSADVGDVLTGVGDSGTDAVVGMDSGTVTLNHTYEVVDTVYLTIDKSVVNQLDPFGGDTAVPGTVTTYRIEVTVKAALDNLVIIDPLPAEVTYVEGSMFKLDGTATELLTSTNATSLTDDSTDADGAKYEDGIDGSGRVTVDLGDQSAAGVITIEFKVTIN